MDVSELRFMLKDLYGSLENLCECIKQQSKEDADNGHHANYTLQPLSFGYTSEEKEFVAPYVIATLKGQQAAEEACKIISGFQRTTGQPKLSVHRALGCIRVSESCAEIVSEINNKKDAIKEALTNLPRRAKAAVVKDAAPGIVLKELYRHIHLVRNPVKINSSWIVSGSSTTVATAADIVPMIRDKIADVEGNGGDSTQLYADLELIQSFYATHQFHIKRQTKPHIRYNVKIAKLWKPIPAHLPLLYVADTEASYKPLTEVDNIRDIERSAPADDVYLIKWLGILK
jgi:hypothetical protein